MKSLAFFIPHLPLDAIYLMVMRNLLLTIGLISTIVSTSCSDPSKEVPIFITVSTEHSGVDFTNTLEYSEQLNPYTFKNFYNGGGVAIGDMNNDGLADIFFCGNIRYKSEPSSYYTKHTFCTEGF